MSSRQNLPYNYLVPNTDTYLQVYVHGQSSRLIPEATLAQLLEHAPAALANAMRVSGHPGDLNGAMNREFKLTHDGLFFTVIKERRPVWPGKYLTFRDVQAVLTALHHVVEVKHLAEVTIQIFRWESTTGGRKGALLGFGMLRRDWILPEGKNTVSVLNMTALQIE